MEPENGQPGGDCADGTGPNLQITRHAAPVCTRLIKRRSRDSKYHITGLRYYALLTFLRCLSSNSTIVLYTG